MLAETLMSFRPAGAKISRKKLTQAFRLGYRITTLRALKTRLDVIAIDEELEDLSETVALGKLSAISLKKRWTPLLPSDLNRAFGLNPTWFTSHRRLDWTTKEG
jgi:hypothetical protein